MQVRIPNRRRIRNYRFGLSAIEWFGQPDQSSRTDIHGDTTTYASSTTQFFLFQPTAAQVSCPTHLDWACHPQSYSWGLYWRIQPKYDTLKFLNSSAECPKSSAGTNLTVFFFVLLALLLSAHASKEGKIAPSFYVKLFWLQVHDFFSRRHSVSMSMFLVLDWNSWIGCGHCQIVWSQQCLEVTHRQYQHGINCGPKIELIKI